MGRAPEGDFSWYGMLLAEYVDFLPHLELRPSLSSEEVQRFVALGKEGWGRLRSGDEAGAAAAFRGQIAIFPPNPDPHVSLALLEAQREARKAALAHLRDAVVRGFTDLDRIERAEAWRFLRTDREFKRLQGAVPRLLETEKAWAGWDSVKVVRPAEDLSNVLRERHTRALAIEQLAPALGERLVRLWNRLNHRATAAALEEYVAAHPQAENAGEALALLLSVYSGGPLFRWEIVPVDTARKLRAVAKAVLDRFADSPLRPGALACRALALYSDRDPKGAMRTGAVDGIRAALGELLSHHAQSAFAAPAAEGLVRTEAEAGRTDLAADAYRRFVDDHRNDPALLEDVRERLGTLALLTGGLPDFRAPALDGGTVERAALSGKVVVIDFWATWCRPCVEQLDVLRRIEKRHGEAIVLLGVNLDSAEDCSADVLREWVAREKVPGRTLHDGQGWDSEIVKAFGTKEIPFSVVVGRDGAVLALNKTGKDLEKAVQAALD